MRLPKFGAIVITGDENIQRWQQIKSQHPKLPRIESESQYGNALFIKTGSEKRDRTLMNALWNEKFYNAQYQADPPSFWSRLGYLVKAFSDGAWEARFPWLS